jgi:hypothetical protein
MQINSSEVNAHSRPYFKVTTSSPVKLEESYFNELKRKAVPLHAMEALGGRGSIAPTHS